MVATRATSGATTDAHRPRLCSWRSAGGVHVSAALNKQPNWGIKDGAWRQGSLCQPLFDEAAAAARGNEEEGRLGHRSLRRRCGNGCPQAMSVPARAPCQGALPVASSSNISSGSSSNSRRSKAAPAPCSFSLFVRQGHARRCNRSNLLPFCFRPPRAQMQRVFTEPCTVLGSAATILHCFLNVTAPHAFWQQMFFKRQGLNTTSVMAHTKRSSDEIQKDVKRAKKRLTKEDIPSGG